MKIYNVLLLVLVLITGGCASITQNDNLGGSSHLYCIDRMKVITLASKYGFRGHTNHEASIWANGSGTKVMVQELINYEPGDIYVFSRGVGDPSRVTPPPKVSVKLDDEGKIIAEADGAHWHLPERKADLYIGNLVTDAHSQWYLKESSNSKIILESLQHSERQIVIKDPPLRAGWFDMQGDRIYFMMDDGGPDRGPFAASLCVIYQRTNSSYAQVSRVKVPGLIYQLDPWSEKVLITKEILPLTWGTWLYDLQTGSQVGVDNVGAIPLFLVDDWFDRRIQSRN